MILLADQVVLTTRLERNVAIRPIMETQERGSMTRMRALLAEEHQQHRSGAHQDKILLEEMLGQTLGLVTTTHQADQADLIIRSVKSAGDRQTMVSLEQELMILMKA